MKIGISYELVVVVVNVDKLVSVKVGWFIGVVILLMLVVLEVSV